MAFTFPLPLTEFADLLRPAAVSMDAQAITEQSMTGAGEALTRNLGPALWGGEVVLAQDYRESGRGAKVLIDMLTRPGTSFLMRDLSYVGPKDDPTGVLLGTATPTLFNVNSNGDVVIDGLPPGYWLRCGDYFAFTYGSNPTRYALHQFAQDRRANAGATNPGRAGLTAVHPPIRPGWVAGAAVTLIKPVCKAIIVPGSVSEASYGPVAMSGLSFRWQQTLR